MTTDGGLTPATRAWLAGAGSRLNEPVREDRPEDVQARAGALADQLDWPDDVKDRFIDAIHDRRRGEAARRLRPVFEAINAALPPGPCPSDPCPLCTAMEDLQSLLLDLEGRT